MTGGALFISSSPPVGEASLRQGDRGRRGLLRLLVEPLQRKEDLATAAFRGEQDAVDHPVAVDPDLPDLAVEMAGGAQPLVADVLHSGEHGRRVVIGETVDERLDRTATCLLYTSRCV